MENGLVRKNRSFQRSTVVFTKKKKEELCEKWVQTPSSFPSGSGNLSNTP
jgi:hypothetical protein